MSVRTTHVGSLPRPADLSALLDAKEHGRVFDENDFAAAADRAVAEAVARQLAVEIDVVNDGEMARTGYATYVQDRLSGFSGDSPSLRFDDLSDFPDYRRRMAEAAGTRRLRRPLCTGAVEVRDPAPLACEIDRLARCLREAEAEHGFMNAASPGVIAIFQKNAWYAGEDAYLEALAGAMRTEYEAIAAAGLTLQVDCPDLAMGRHVAHARAGDDEFVRHAETLVDVLNAALVDVPPERARMHVCWGNYEGPHHRDIELDRIFPVLMKAKPQALSFEAANPRHAHEWTVFRDRRLPEDKILIPGVIDSTTNYVEHPRLVAERIRRFVDLVGADRVIAGADCGFATFAGIGKVDPEIAWLKLAALAEGAALVRP